MTVSQLPRCSVVISTRNRPDLLLDTVRSLLEGIRLPDEVVIVDQSDEACHGSAQLQETAACEIKWLRSKTRGQSVGRNIGLREARYEAIALTDDDVLVEPDWLERMLTALELDGLKMIATSRVLPTAAEVAGGRAVSVKTEETSAVYEGRLSSDVLFGNSMAFFRSAVDEVGDFDERLGPGGRYPSADDNDFGYRLLEAGYRIRYVPEAVVHHRSWRAGRALRRLNWIYGRGQGAFYAKHTRLRDPDMLLRLADNLRERGVRIAFRPLRRRSLAGHGDLIYTAGLLTAFIQWHIAERAISGPWRHGRRK